MTVPPLTDRQRRHVYRREAPLRDAARRYLSKLDHAKIIKFHGSAFTEAGTPDTLLVWHGLACWFEWKRGGESAEKIQAARIRRLRYCGSPCYVCSTMGDVESALGDIIAHRLDSSNGRACWLHAPKER